MAAGNSYAQPQVPIPNPAWPLDSAVNGSVHFYTVQGDHNYASPSTFVWTVLGGRLFNDEALTSMAGDGTTATVAGYGANLSRLWVIWDVFQKPIQTGYIYAYEISADGCQGSNSDAKKFQGMRMKIYAPPITRFLTKQTIACSNLDSARIIVEINGIPPYDMIYTVNGERKTWHITSDDLSDLDGDGKANNVSFFYSGLSSSTTDMVYSYKIDSVSSEGVNGKFIDFSTHDLIVHVQPPAPVILPNWIEVTVGTTKTYQLSNPGVNAVEWFWNLKDIATNPITSFNSTSLSTFKVTYNNQPGLYYVETQYRDNYGCYSSWDSLNIELFNRPTIAFSDSTPNIINCSATMPMPNEKFDFVVEYEGAKSYGFTYAVYDYNGTLVDGGTFDYLTNRSNIISINNTFVNDALPEKNRPWKVVIKTAHNEESDVNVKIVDSDKEGGKDERIIMIYPKPLIQDDIDFAN
jgi:hypothetical protein